jgi:hypothetical protein
MSDDSTLRTEEDLQRVVRAPAREFKTDTVFIIGSQAILISWPDVPGVMRGSPEIDAYPANARIWELTDGSKGDGPSLEASEHINGLFVSKLARLDDKDKVFVEAYNSTRPLDMALIEERIAATDLDPAVAARAVAYVRGLAASLAETTKPLPDHG